MIHRHRRLLSILGLAALLYALFELQSRVFRESLTAGFSWSWMSASALFTIVELWFGARIWIELLKRLNVQEHLPEHLTNYWVSLPLRSLGGLWGSSAGQIWLSKTTGLSHKTFVRALFWDRVYVASATLVGTLVLAVIQFVWPQLISELWQGMALLTLAIGGCVPFLYVRQRNTSEKPSFAAIAALYVVPLQGCALMATLTLALGLGIREPARMIEVALAYYVSWWLGQLAFFIPQGLGVRETAFAFFTKQGLTLKVSVLFALWARLLPLVAMLICAAFIALRQMIVSRRKPINL